MKHKARLIKNTTTACGSRFTHFALILTFKHQLHKTTFATETSPQMVIFTTYVLSTKIRKFCEHYYTISQKSSHTTPQRWTMAKIHHFTYQKVSINSAKSRWGSCSATGKINLSCYLLLLPDRLIDFVLIHELCHTREMNHGKEFKRLMRSIFSDYDNLNKELKNTTIKPI